MAVSYSTSAQPSTPKPLSAKQLRAVLELANGKTQAQTAQIVGVSPQTLCKWASLPEFQTLLEDIIAQRTMTPEQYLQRQRMKAAQALVSLMRDAPPATRLRAAQAVLDYRLPQETQEEIDLIDKVVRDALEDERHYMPLYRD